MSHEWSTEQLRAMTLDVLARIEATGRTTPVPALSARALARMEAAAALERAIEEQDREADALQQLFVGVEAAAAAEQAAEAAAAQDAPRPASPAGEERAAATAGV